MRGPYSTIKERALQREILKYHPMVVALQETKKKRTLMRELWDMVGNSPHKCHFIPSISNSGELAILWDDDNIEIHDLLIGAFSLLLHCSLKGKGDEWVVTCIYGLIDSRYKSKFWEKLSFVDDYWDLPWLLMGDFYTVRWQDEKSRGCPSRRKRKDFNNFIDNFVLLEFRKEGPKFSYSEQRVNLFFG